MQINTARGGPGLAGRGRLVPTSRSIQGFTRGDSRAVFGVRMASWSCSRANSTAGNGERHRGHTLRGEEPRDKRGTLVGTCAGMSDEGGDSSGLRENGVRDQRGLGPPMKGTDVQLRVWSWRTVRARRTTTSAAPAVRPKGWIEGVLLGERCQRLFVRIMSRSTTPCLICLGPMCLGDRVRSAVRTRGRSRFVASTTGHLVHTAPLVTNEGKVWCLERGGPERGAAWAANPCSWMSSGATRAASDQESNAWRVLDTRVGCIVRGGISAIAAHQAVHAGWFIPDSACSRGGSCGSLLSWPGRVSGNTLARRRSRAVIRGERWFGGDSAGAQAGQRITEVATGCAATRERYNNLYARPIRLVIREGDHESKEGVLGGG